MAKQSGNVLKDKKRRLFGFKDTRDVKKERASRIFKATALSGNGKALAGESGAEQVEVRLSHLLLSNQNSQLISEMLKRMILIR